MDTETMDLLKTLQAAMLEAQARTGDCGLACSVKQGTFQLQRVVYDNVTKSGKRSARPTITPLSDFLPLAQYLATLRTFDVAR